MKITLESKEKYKNKKTGKVYYFMRAIADRTNSREGEIIIYYFDPVNYEHHTRESTDFFEKFEKVEE